MIGISLQLGASVRHMVRLPQHMSTLKGSKSKESCDVPDMQDLMGEKLKMAKDKEGATTAKQG